MNAHELARALLELPADARLIAVDQFGATYSPVTGARTYAGEDIIPTVFLDIEVETDGDE